MPLFFIPLGDEKDEKTVIPFIKYLLIAANIAVFFIFQTGEKGTKFTMGFSLVPKEIVTGKDEVTAPTSILDPETDLFIDLPGLAKTPQPVWMTMITSMFMHAGMMHLVGNMFYLWIFATAVEDEMGHEKFLIFYLFMGVGAAFAHVFMNASGQSAMIPYLGASGAIAGVLGAYIVHHPLRNVNIMVLRAVITLPAWVFIGLWFLLQIYGGLQPAPEGALGGGVAFAAHIGGFLLGALLGLAFSNPKPPPEYVTREQIIKMREDLYNDTEGIYTNYAEFKDRDWN